MCVCVCLCVFVCVSRGSGLEEIPAKCQAIVGKVLTRSVGGGRGVGGRWEGVQRGWDMGD